MKNNFILAIFLCFFIISCQQNSIINPSFPQNQEAYYGEWTCTKVERDTGTGLFFSGITTTTTTLFDLKINAGEFQGYGWNSISLNSGYYFPYTFNSNDLIFSISYIDSLNYNPPRSFEAISTVDHFNERATPNLSTMRLIHAFKIDGVEVVNPDLPKYKISYERSR